MASDVQNTPTAHRGGSPSVRYVDPDLVPSVPETDFPDWRSWGFWAGLLAMLAIAAFLPSMLGGFVWNDDRMVEQNVALRSWRGIWAIWRFPHTFPQFSPAGFSLLLLEFQVFARAARAAAGYHMVSLVLHSCNALLLWTLLRRLDLRGAWLASALWATHPMLWESVGWISQQPQLLGTAFMLSSLLVYCRYCGLNPVPYERQALLRLPERPAILYALSTMLFLGALLSHPGAAVLPLVVVLLIWWERGRVEKSDWLAQLPWMGTTLVVLALAMVLRLREPAEDGSSPIGPIGWFLVACRSVCAYVLGVIAPFKLAFSYPQWQVRGSTLAWVFPALMVVMLAGCWIAARRFGRAVPAAALLFVALLLPSMLFPSFEQMRWSYVADSVVYLAAAAVVVPVTSMLVDRFGPPHGQRLSPYSLSPWIASVVLVGFMCLSITQSRVLKSNESLWADTLDKYPSNVSAHQSLAEIAMSRESYREAEDHIRRALELDRTHIPSLLSAGKLYQALRQPDRALGSYFAVKQLRADSIEAEFGLASTYEQLGNTSAAIAAYENVLKARPKDDLALNNLGMIHAERGDGQVAERYYRRAIEVNPRSIPARINLANLLYARGGNENLELAVQQLDKVVEINPESFEAFMNAGAMLGNLKEYQMAEKFFRHAVRLKRDSAEAYNNLGIALLAQQKIEEAVFCFDRAAELAPTNPTFRKNRQSARELLPK